MGLELRTSSTTAGGAANAISLGGRPSATGPSASAGAFWDNVTSAQNDTGLTEYRCLFVYNSGSTVMNNVKVACSNLGGGSTVTVAASSIATTAFASYTTAVIASETTAPSVTGSYGSSVGLGTLNPGDVKAVWLKRVVPAKVAAVSADKCSYIISAAEVIPESAP